MKTIEELQKEIYETAKSKGWYDNGGAENIGERLALIHSEVSEALEADRRWRYCDIDNPNYNVDGLGLRKASEVVNDEKFVDIFKTYIKDTFEDELSDIVIRCLDMAEHLKIDLSTHVLLKMRYNKTRPIKHGGKRY